MSDTTCDQAMKGLKLLILPSWISPVTFIYCSWMIPWRSKRNVESWNAKCSILFFWSVQFGWCAGTAFHEETCFLQVPLVSRLLFIKLTFLPREQWSCLAGASGLVSGDFTVSFLALKKAVLITAFSRKWTSDVLNFWIKKYWIVNNECDTYGRENVYLWTRTNKPVYFKYIFWKLSSDFV